MTGRARAAWVSHRSSGPCLVPRCLGATRYAGASATSRVAGAPRPSAGASSTSLPGCSPAYRGEATAVWQGLRSGSSPRKNGSSARVLTMAAADVIRPTVHNRVDNQVRGASLANHRHRRSDRSPSRFTCYRVSRRDQVAPPQPHRCHFADRAAAHRAGLGSATCSRREERRR
jgi:hypothetical protein